MESKTFSRNSWAYRFLTWPNGFWFGRPFDICELRRHVLIKVMLLVVGALLGFTISSGVTAYLLYMAGKFVGGPFSIFYAYGVYPLVQIGGIITVLALAITALLAAVIGINKLGVWLHNLKYSRPPKEDGPLKSMYKSWKEKLCYQIDFQ